MTLIEMDNEKIDDLISDFGLDQREKFQSEEDYREFLRDLDKLYYRIVTEAKRSGTLTVGAPLI